MHIDGETIALSDMPIFALHLQDLIGDLSADKAIYVVRIYS
jgi:hypothetical protein